MKTKMAALASDGLTHLSTERNLTKLDRKQELNVLYNVMFFEQILSSEMVSLGSDRLRHYDFFLYNP